MSGASLDNRDLGDRAVEALAGIGDALGAGVGGVWKRHMAAITAAGEAAYGASSDADALDIRMAAVTEVRRGDEGGYDNKRKRVWRRRTARVLYGCVCVYMLCGVWCGLCVRGHILRCV